MSLLRLACVGLAALALLVTSRDSHSAPAVEAAVATLPIRSISTSFSEEEGGFAHRRYHASGWLEFTGHASCCGYKPELENGWYRVPSATMQALFDAAARAIALGRAGAEPVHEMNGSSTEIITADGRHFYLLGALVSRPADQLGVAAGKRPRPARTTAPADANKLVYVGRHIKNLAVLRALGGELAGVAKFSGDDVDQLVAALLKEPGGSAEQSARVGRLLAAIPDAAIDRVGAMLAGPRPAGLRSIDLVTALGQHGAAAQPYAAAIAATTIDDGTLVSASLALSRVGGAEATRLLETNLVPRLAQAPREPALQMYYRLEFARALRRIELPAARTALHDVIYPIVHAHVTGGDADAMKDADVALEVYDGLPEAKQLAADHTALFVRVLRSAVASDRARAAERLHHRYTGRPPETLRVELERLRADSDANVRNWATRALTP